MKIVFLLVLLLPGQPVISEHDTKLACLAAAVAATKEAPAVRPWLVCVEERRQEI